jgi:hypothetical protein
VYLVTLTVIDEDDCKGTDTVIITVKPKFKEVLIDIKPGSYPNSINLDSTGVVPVAILSNSTFDATNVDPATIKLAGAEVARKGKKNKLRASIEDVNGDGLKDLSIKILIKDLIFDELKNGWGILTGELYDGTPIIGKDTLNIVKSK